MEQQVTLQDIIRAEQRLKKVLNRMPLMRSDVLSERYDCNVYLKREDLQVVRSFKIRGAYNKMHTLPQEVLARGVVCASAGNHAQGVAFSCRELEVEGKIFMPVTTPKQKIRQVTRFGGQFVEIVLAGDTFDDSAAAAQAYCDEHGMAFIHPFDDEDVMAGQGTIALEILRDLPGVDMIFVPAGGGGLISGVAACAKQINPRIQISGVQAEGAPAIANSFRTGERTPSDTVHTIADGIAVKTPGEKTFEYIKKYVDRVVTVSDDEIASAVLLLLERCKQVVETSGAAPLAAVLNNKVDVKGKKVVCVLSGGNIDVSFIHKIVEKGLITRCRQLKFSVLMPDAPGALEHFSHIVAQQNANIILFQHDRVQTDLEIGEAIIHVVCEVGGVDHAKRLIDTLTDDGYKVFTSQI